MQLLDRRHYGITCPWSRILYSYPWIKKSADSALAESVPWDSGKSNESTRMHHLKKKKKERGDWRRNTNIKSKNVNQRERACVVAGGVKERGMGRKGQKHKIVD